MKKEIVGVMVIFSLFIIGLLTSVIISPKKPLKPIYSVYIIWDNHIIQNDTTSYVDSTQYIFDKDNTQLVVNRIQ